MQTPPSRGSQTRDGELRPQGGYVGRRRRSPTVVTPLSEVGVRDVSSRLEEKGKGMKLSM